MIIHTSNHREPISAFFSFVLFLSMLSVMIFSAGVSAGSDTFYPDTGYTHVIISSGGPASGADISPYITSLDIKNLSLIYEFESYSMYEADVPTHLINSINQIPSVIDVVRDISVHNCTSMYNNSSSDDPARSRQWYLDTIDFEYYGNDDTYPSGKDTVVAIIDSGTDYNHPDLIDNLWINNSEADGEQGVDDDNNGYTDDIYGYDFYNDDPYPMDDSSDSHGTHVAGIVGMTAGNSSGGTGVAYNTRLMLLKASDASGNFGISKVIKALSYAVNNGADVINLSFGAPMSSSPTRDKLEAAISDASKHCAVFAAAGNKSLVTSDAAGHGFTAPAGDYYPAAFNNVTGVMSSDSSNNLSGFSNWSYSSGADAIYGLIAPGEYIYSTARNNTYAYNSGTSMSTPIVSGIAASLISSFKALGRSYDSSFIRHIIEKASTHYVDYTASDMSIHRFTLANLKDTLDYEPIPELTISNIELHNQSTGASLTDVPPSSGNILSFSFNVYNDMAAASGLSFRISPSDTYTAGCISTGDTIYETGTLEHGSTIVINGSSTDSLSFTINEHYANTRQPLSFNIIAMCSNEWNTDDNNTYTFSTHYSYTYPGVSPTMMPSETPAYSGTPVPSDTPMPSYVPAHSYSPAPSHSPASSYSPAPSHTPASSYSPAPSHTPASSYSPAPSHTPASSYSPAPSHTPLPSDTSFPSCTDTAPAPHPVQTPYDISSIVPVHSGNVSTPQNHDAKYQKIYSKIRPKLLRKTLYYNSSRKKYIKIIFKNSIKKYKRKFSYNRKYLKITSHKSYALVKAVCRKNKKTQLIIILTDNITGKKYRYRFTLNIRRR